MGKWKEERERERDLDSFFFYFCLFNLKILTKPIKKGDSGPMGNYYFYVFEI